MKITFAFAADSSEKLHDGYFGDAHKFLLYEVNGENFEFVKTVENHLKEEAASSLRKADLMIKFLKDHKVTVLVSNQFGTNIKLIHYYFIPVLVSELNISIVISVLKKHIKWIKESFQSKPRSYKLFTINKGVLKSIIEE